MIEQKKLVYFIPNIFTALNLACGYFSILQSFEGNFRNAALLIALGCFFDLMDGRMARFMGAQSSFGEQFDSLSDLLTFVVAPSILFFNVFLDGYGRLGVLTCFLYCLCGALRLARFNANIGKVDSNYFQGLPSPSSALALVGLVLYFQEYGFPAWFPQRLMALYIAFYALLMISTLPFPAFKNSQWILKNKRKMLITIMLLILCVVLNEEVMLFVVISLYVICSLVYAFLNRKALKSSLLEEDDHIEV